MKNVLVGVRNELQKIRDQRSRKFSVSQVAHQQRSDLITGLSLSTGPVSVTEEAHEEGTSRNPPMEQVGHKRNS